MQRIASSDEVGIAARDNTPVSVASTAEPEEEHLGNSQVTQDLTLNHLTRIQKFVTFFSRRVPGFSRVCRKLYDFYPAIKAKFMVLHERYPRQVMFIVSAWTLTTSLAVASGSFFLAPFLLVSIPLTYLLTPAKWILAKENLERLQDMISAERLKLGAKYASDIVDDFIRDHNLPDEYKDGYSSLKNSLMRLIVNTLSYPDQIATLFAFRMMATDTQSALKMAEFFAISDEFNFAEEVSNIMEFLTLSGQLNVHIGHLANQIFKKFGMDRGSRKAQANYVREAYSILSIATSAEWQRGKFGFQQLGRLEKHKDRVHKCISLLFATLIHYCEEYYVNNQGLFDVESQQYFANRTKVDVQERTHKLFMSVLKVKSGGVLREDVVTALSVVLHLTNIVPRMLSGNPYRAVQVLLWGGVLAMSAYHYMERPRIIELTVQEPIDKSSTLAASINTALAKCFSSVTSGIERHCNDSRCVESCRCMSCALGHLYFKLQGSDDMFQINEDYTTPYYCKDKIRIVMRRIPIHTAEIVSKKYIEMWEENCEFDSFMIHYMNAFGRFVGKKLEAAKCQGLAYVDIPFARYDVLAPYTRYCVPFGVVHPEASKANMESVLDSIVSFASVGSTPALLLSRVESLLAWSVTGDLFLPGCMTDLVDILENIHHDFADKIAIVSHGKDFNKKAAAKDVAEAYDATGAFGQYENTDPDAERHFREMKERFEQDEEDFQMKGGRKRVGREFTAEDYEAIETARKGGRVSYFNWLEDNDYVYFPYSYPEEDEREVEPDVGGRGPYPKNKKKSKFVRHSTKVNTVRVPLVQVHKVIMNTRTGQCAACAFPVKEENVEKPFWIVALDIFQLPSNLGMDSVGRPSASVVAQCIDGCKLTIETHVLGKLKDSKIYPLTAAHIVPNYTCLYLTRGLQGELVAVGYVGLDLPVEGPLLKLNERPDEQAITKPCAIHFAGGFIEPTIITQQQQNLILCRHGGTHGDCGSPLLHDRKLVAVYVGSCPQIPHEARNIHIRVAKHLTTHPISMFQINNLKNHGAPCVDYDTLLKNKQVIEDLGDAQAEHLSFYRSLVAALAPEGGVLDAPTLEKLVMPYLVPETLVEECRVAFVEQVNKRMSSLAPIAIDKDLPLLELSDVSIPIALADNFKITINPAKRATVIVATASSIYLKSGTVAEHDARFVNIAIRAVCSAKRTKSCGMSQRFFSMKSELDIPTRIEVIKQMFRIDLASGNNGIAPLDKLRNDPAQAKKRIVVLDAMVEVHQVAVKTIAKWEKDYARDLKTDDTAVKFLTASTTEIQRLWDDIACNDPTRQVHRVPFTKEEPYKQKKLKSGYLRNVWSLGYGLRMYVLLCCLTKEGGGYVSPTHLAQARMEVYGFDFRDPKEEVAAFVAKHREHTIVSYDVSSFEGVLTPAMVYIMLRRLTPMSIVEAIWTTIAVNHCPGRIGHGADRVYMNMPFFWTSGQNLTLYGNTFMHHLITLSDEANTPFLGKTLQGDDGLVALKKCDAVTAITTVTTYFKKFGIAVEVDTIETSGQIHLEPKFCGVYASDLASPALTLERERKQALGVLLRMLARPGCLAQSANTADTVYRLLKGVGKGDCPHDWAAHQARKEAELE
jgi:hypothetical protein